jgi:hypothetical protein
VAKTILKFVLIFLIFNIFLRLELSFAACGANTRTWQADAGTSVWTNNTNWNPRNQPTTASENALIKSDWFNPLYPGSSFSLGCLEVQSGLLTLSAGGVLTIVGDYFKNPNLGSIVVPGGSTWEVYMQATANQSFENVDTIPRLRISNSATITLTKSFVITNRFLIDAGTNNVVIQGNLELQQTTAFSIPASTTLTLESGASLSLAGNLTVDGILVMEPGSILKLANGRTLTISATGTLDVNGISGNAVTIKADNSSSTFSFISNGVFDVQYLVLDNMTSTGLRLNSTVSRLDYVNINNILASGYGITLGAGFSLPANITGVGFYKASGGGTFRNVNATSYNGSIAQFKNWSGIGDTANETDPSNKINWGTEAPAVLQVSNLSASGIPPATIAKSSAYTQFATFGFSMSSTIATATEVTQLILTLAGSNYNSDITGVRVYRDSNNNCTYNAGTDALVGTYSPIGIPGKITVNLSSGELSLIDSTVRCLFVLLSTSAGARTDNTIGISINSTDDITNSLVYDISATNGPPISTSYSTITGSAVARWNGGYGTNMFTTTNWTPSGVPTTTTDCQIGNGYSIPIMSAAFTCQNTTLLSSGLLNWNSTANTFSISGAWIVESGFTYQNATTAIVNLTGSTNKSLSFNSTTFPGTVNSNNTATTTVESSGTITGNLNINNGRFAIASGASLTVSGNITVASGATLDVDPGGLLILGNNAVVTINSGGTIEFVGTSSSIASLKAINDTSRYTINVNNGATISARYYSLRNLGLTGLTINATANIDGTNHLQNGTFIYPGINNANLLRLYREIPTDTLDSMAFQKSTSTATGVKSIFTSVASSVDTLLMTNYSGDMTGATFTTAPVYPVSWTSATNELKLTQESIAPASSNQGSVVNMGNFGFQQLNAGAFSNTDITSIRITLIGTGTSGDVDSVNLYYNSTCSGSGGTLIGSLAFTGNPARAVFSGITGATVQSHATTPPKRCFNVTYNLNALATNGKTVGAEISSSTHVTNSQNYAFNSGFAPAVNLGTTSIVGSTTQWTGASSTNWFTAGNWSGGVPTANLNCIINDKANDPIIASGTAICKSVSIGNGILSMTGGSLEVYGSLESTGTITSTRPIILRDNGTTPSSQNLSVTSTINTLQFNKTAGGSVNVASDVTVTTALSMAVTQNFTLNINTNSNLTLTAGLTLTGGTIDMKSGSGLRIASGQILLVNGGTFKTSGTNDAFPQTLSTKAQLTNAGGTGTWAFTATSGTLNLTGFYIEWLNTSGLNISGTTNLTNLNGGQLRNLPSTAGMRALQLNTSGSLPTTASNFGWNWGPSNSPPSELTAYSLGYSSGCGNKTIDFDQWFGDFWPYTSAVTTANKISTTNCTILIDRAKSPVSLTEFKATPYDSKVVIEWTTGNEWDHKGFNIYRSLSPNNSFVQINSEIIRNDLFSTNIHGTYAFIDSGVTNGLTYYYMLEDLSLMGQSQLHGPIEALPDVTLGSPPLIQAGTVVSNGTQTGDGHNDNSGGQTSEISQNVWLLSQTQNYMRLKIKVPAMSLINDPLNGSYKKLLIDGYSHTTEAGLPELPSKTILIKIDKNLNSTQWQKYSELKTQINAIDVTPAPQFVNNSGTLQAQWTINNSFYNQNQSSPVSNIELKNVVTLNNESFLPIVILPVSYNPVSRQLDKIDEIVLDLYLQGTPPWSVINSSKNPWTREAGIKLGTLKEGMYQVTYDQLANAGVIAPLKDVNINNIHMRISDVKMGLQIDSMSGYFSNGDSIRFYAPSLFSDEEEETSAILYVDSGEVSTMLNPVDGSLGSEPLNNLKGFWTKTIYEENNIAVFNEPFTEETDHFVWSLIYGISGGAKSPLITNIQLPYLKDNSEVAIRVTVKSRRSNSENTLHNLEIYLNGSNQLVTESSFEAVESKLITFRIPARHFVSGLNKIKFQASGNNLLSGEYDMLYIDKFEVYHSQDWLANQDESLILDQNQNSAYQLNGFSSTDISIYDVSNPTKLIQLNNLNIGTNSFGKYVQFALKNLSEGRRLWAGTSSQFKSVSSYQLIESSDLKNSTNEADIIYLGHKEMLTRVKSLGNLRESQGYKVKYVNLQSIYNEFGFGKANVSTIKEFIESSRNWLKAPRYIILLGDGSYDPKGFQNDILKYRFPVKYKKGSSFDYVSDHWFVANDEGIPQEIIGRIPAKNPSELSDYVDKVIAYENGSRKPAIDSQLTFFSDKALYTGEDFEKPIADIQSLDNNQLILNPMTHIKRSDLTNAQMKSAILNSMGSSSLIHYMGHGAENMWADANVFNNNDVSLLNQNTLPVVVAMNCLNAQYSDPDLDSLAERMVLNKKGGAILFWGSSSFTPPSIQKVYQEAFYNQLISGQFESMGDLIKMAKIQGGLSSPFEELLYSWTILGDPLIKPALNYKVTSSQPANTPIPNSVSSQDSQSLSGGGCAAFANSDGNKVNTPWLLILSFFFESLLALLIIRKIIK